MMRPNSNMNGWNQLTEHHEFIASTDRKSLYTQIKNLVQQAQTVASKELNQRRNSLKQLLEHEDKIFEEEFTSKVKSRIDEDIGSRKGNLLKIKEESARNELEFLKSKRIQQHMNSCYEIREALRSKETQHVKECQLQQMLDRERAVKEEQEVEHYWLQVQGIHRQLLDERQQKEDGLKKALGEKMAAVRNTQLQEMLERRESERQARLEEKNTLQAQLEELRLENFDRKLRKQSSAVADYRQELLEMMTQKREMQEKEEQEERERRRKAMSDLARLEAEETAAAIERKKQFFQATMDFMQFSKGLRELEQQQQQMLNDRIEDLRRVDMCTKGNILVERERKAHLAAQCHAALRQQICEQREKRLREEAEYRECKLMENRFVHKEMSRKEMLEKKLKNRRGLDKQIEELKKMRDAENAKFSVDLERASHDSKFCAELAETYIREGVDYLPPHANWRLLPSSSDNYFGKPTKHDP